MSEPLDRWLKHSPMSDPGSRASLFDSLPVDISALCRAVQGIVLHADWAAAYGLSASHFAPSARETLPLERRLLAIEAADPRPLCDARAVEGRSPGTCRDYALILCSVLRQRKMPARIRCGFAAYFNEGPWEDHWVCEYWQADESRWRRVDAQLDDVQRQRLGIAFDTTDLPPDMYITAGDAWHLCRTNRGDPAGFGHGAAKGLWFVRVNVVRDHYALNQAETSSWDTWRQAKGPHLLVGDDDRRATDVIARQPEAAKVDRLPPWLA